MNSNQVNSFASNFNKKQRAIFKNEEILNINLLY